MELKEIVVHRVRDIDSVLRSNQKIKLGKYILLRTFGKIKGLNEDRLINKIPFSNSTLQGFTFSSREKTLDFLFYSRYYEPQTTKYLLNKKGRNFIDIGSHIGRFALIGSKVFNKVFAFEANPYNFSVLKKNIHSNNINNILPLNLAVSDSKKNLLLDMPKLNTGATTISKFGKIKTSAVSLDKFLIKNKVPYDKIDLVLIDVEGHEDKVLEGAKNFLSKTSSDLIIECFNPEKIEKMLLPRGYRKKKVLDFYNYLFTKE